MTTIKARAQDQVLTATILPKLACNNRKSVKLHVDFDSAWDGYAKSALFNTSNDTTVYAEVLDSNGECILPHEVLADAGFLFISIQGINSDTSQLKSTSYIQYRVLPGTPSLVVSAPSPSVYEQLATKNKVLEARMNTIEMGSTVEGSEVSGIRAGYDGTEYDSAGDAVREQVSDIHSIFANASINANTPITEIKGYYISSTGAKFENESYSISAPLFVAAGYTLKFTARGYKSQVAMISEVKSDGSYLPLVNSTDSELRTYEYKATEDMKIAFSWAISNPHSLIIVGNVADVSIANAKKVLKEAANIDNVSLSLFSKFGVVGDSYASGEMHFNGKFNDIYNVSWGQILARKTGASCVNFSAGGLSTKGWLTHSKGLPLMLSTEAQDVYYLALGINDANNYGNNYLGTIADIKADFTQNADSFFGNYGKIISNIKEHAPNAKIVMFTMVATTEMKATYNEAIIEIANHFEIPYIIQSDDDFFNSDFYANGKVQSHPIAVVYSGMANAFERLLKKCILNNFDYFANAFMH